MNEQKTRRKKKKREKKKEKNNNKKKLFSNLNHNNNKIKQQYKYRPLIKSLILLLSQSLQLFQGRIKTCMKTLTSPFKKLSLECFFHILNTCKSIRE